MSRNDSDGSIWKKWIMVIKLVNCVCSAFVGIDLTGFNRI